MVNKYAVWNGALSRMVADSLLHNFLLGRVRLDKVTVIFRLGGTRLIKQLSWINTIW
ncbi:MAG TPA: hypothetical protein VEH56_07915 [Candidatus Saccharimonadales bacterium]|nr:hypothetical protein [Candidatus Saccharimonadales bacterium]